MTRDVAHVTHEPNVVDSAVLSNVVTLAVDSSAVLKEMEWGEAKAIDEDDAADGIRNKANQLGQTGLITVRMMV